MSNSECSILFLTTIAGIYNDQYNLSCTWENINLRTVLGTMYDKYDVFSLQLNYIGQGYVSSSTLSASLNNNLVFIELSGLPLINNTYNIIKQNNTNATIIAVYEINPQNIDSQQYPNPSKVLFGKNSEMVDITINLLTNFLQTPVATAQYPYMSYSFNIYGIPKEKDDLNNTRMIR
jgi:hypothetical protein